MQRAPLMNIGYDTVCGKVRDRNRYMHIVVVGGRTQSTHGYYIELLYCTFVKTKSGVARTRSPAALAFSFCSSSVEKGIPRDSRCLATTSSSFVAKLSWPAWVPWGHVEGIIAILVGSTSVVYNLLI